MPSVRLNALAMRAGLSKPERAATTLASSPVVVMSKRACSVRTRSMTLAGVAPSSY